ncbi:MAG TPA: energy transducer TonB [Candidatus Sulfotelmatobacter sp.]
MYAAVRSLPIPQAVAPPIREPRLLVELPSWPKVFFANLRDLLHPPKLAPLRLTSAPAPFWPDVFVQRRMPWRRFAESTGCHVLAIALVGISARWLGARVQPLPPASFERDQVIIYQPTEYLPPLNTLPADSEDSGKADPVAAAQPIISVPAEADNRRQTIVTAPSVKLKHDVALPNMVAWDEKPTMPIAPAPLIPAASLSRLSPDVDNSVVAPPPDTQRLARRRDLPQMQASVVAPPPDVIAAASKVFQSPQAAVIEPPPNVEAISARAGDINIGHTSVIAPAPQLSLAEQRATRRSAARAATQVGLAQVIPPPPSLKRGSGVRSGGSPAGTPMVALSLHPAVGAPPDSPAGNRRGNFAASADGKAAASGAPGSASGSGAGAGNRGKGTGNGASTSKNGLPAGLYEGNPSTPATSTVAGDPSAENKTGRDSVNPNLLASARPPRVTAQSPHALWEGDASRLSEAERQVFGDRKFYSLTLNMPNLNSAGGSWVIRFAELQKSGNAQAVSSLSAPAAVRKVDPAYPMQLMRENVAGTVIVYAVIHADGSVGNVRVLRSVDERIDEFASQAVAKWKFDPATKNGAPVEVEATFQIPFHPARGF